MNDIKKVRKKINEDWLDAFPQLTKYSQGKFYKILGSVLTGIELIKLPNVEEYIPHFVIYSLWGNKKGSDLKACLSGPIVLKQFFNKKGLQYSVSYYKHDLEFSELLNDVKEQIPFSFEGDIPLHKVLSAIDEYSKTPPLSAAPNSYLQAILQEFKLELVLCNDNNDKVDDLFDQIKRRKWNLEHFSMCNVNYDDWLKKIEDNIVNKDELISRLNANKQDKKLEKLLQSSIK